MLVSIQFDSHNKRGSDIFNVRAIEFLLRYLLYCINSNKTICQFLALNLILKILRHVHLRIDMKTMRDNNQSSLGGTNRSVPDGKSSAMPHDYGSRLMEYAQNTISNISNDDISVPTVHA